LNGTPVQIQFIACGHGDMSLLRLPGEKWVLIDCRLPSRDDQNRFIALVERLNVRRLDLLILTHPHYDHYAGMADVVSYFTRDGRSIGRFGTSGPNSFDVSKMIEARGRPPEEVSEYLRLWRVLIPLIERNELDHVRLDDDVRPVEFEAAGRSVRLIALAPRSSKVALAAFRQLTGDQPVLAVNDLSVVLVLQVSNQDKVFQAIFTADVETDQLERAIRMWHLREENLTPDAAFQVTKVPHHGSGNGHCAALVSARRSGRSVAAISVGTRYRLPKREVVASYQDGGWTVLSTTTTHAAPRKLNPLISQFSRTARTDAMADAVMRMQNIIVTWGPTQGVEFSPPEAEIQAGDLAAYPI
jgi:beta-lactamase superfamily II metal-dependent hydrolase